MPEPSNHSLSFALVLAVLAAPALVGGCYIYPEQSADRDVAPAPGRPGNPGAPPRPGGYPPDSEPRPDAAIPPDRGADAGSASACPGLPLDRWKELLIVEPSVMTDSRARNDVPDAPWSFRRRLEDLSGARATAGDLAWNWFSHWRWGHTVAAAPGMASAPRVAVTPRPSVDDEILCPWLRLSPANGCTPTCTSCSDRRLDLARAPFRLIAIVNRADLGQGAGACSRDGGELRFIYTALSPHTQMPLPFTIIFEYRVSLPAGQDRRGWAAAWRALGRLPFSPSYNARLDEIVAQGLGAARLQRVQSNEIALGQPLGLPWELRQFVPLAGERGGVSLEPTAPAHTPRLSLDGTSELAGWLAENRGPILEGDNLLPPNMLAGSAILEEADFSWQAPGADPDVLSAFNANTCNGCHGGRADPADLPFQHVGSDPGNTPGSPYYQSPAAGPARVSSYLHDPRGGEDELGRRGRMLEATACEACTSATYPR